MSGTMTEDRLKTRFDRWDNDHSGTLEWSDFEAEAGKIARSLGTHADSPEAQKLFSAYRGIFDYIAGHAGVGANGSVTESQFRNAAQELIEQGEHAFNRVLRPLAEGIVSLCDKNADRMINREEFVAWTRVLGLSADEGDDAFRRIDVNGDGELTVDELLGAIRAYHTGQLDVELISVR